MALRFSYLSSLVFSLFLSSCLPASSQQFRPFLTEQNAVYRLAEQKGIQTWKRPVAGGIYDKSVNQTFVAWLGENSNSYVQAFDHATGTWTAPKLVGQVSKSEYFEGADSHNYPLLIQANDGHLLVFYAEHSSELRLARSSKPHSIEAWTDGVIPQGFSASYPIPLKTKGGDIYVFFRESSFFIDKTLDLDDRPMQYLVSTDNAKTWKHSKDLTGEKIALGSRDRPDNLDEIYMGQARYQPRMGLLHERIHLVWTLAGGGFEGPRHDRYHKDVYYAYFRPSNKHFYCAGGKDKGKSLSAADMKDCLVEDTGALTTSTPHSVDYIQLVHYTNKANPVLIYKLNHSTGSTMRSATWTGKNWVYGDVPTEGFILDMEKTGPNSFSFYAGRGQIFAYTTQDAGQTWKLDYSFSLPENKRVVKLNVIDDYKEPARFLITEATTDMVPSADIFIAGRATCLQTGTFYIVSTEGDYLSSSAGDALRLSDATGKASQWQIRDTEGYCTLLSESSKQGLKLQGEEAKWLIIGAADGQVQLQELSSGLYLKTDLSFAEADEESYWVLEPLR